jgi:hypothetical protein
MKSMKRFLTACFEKVKEGEEGKLKRFFFRNYSAILPSRNHPAAKIDAGWRGGRAIPTGRLQPPGGGVAGVEPPQRG